MLLLTTADNRYASLPAPADTVPGAISPVKSLFDPCLRGGNMGCDHSSVDSTSSDVPCSSQLLAHTAVANGTPGCATTSNKAPPTTQYSSRDHQPLLTMEGETTLVQEAENSKISRLKYFLIGILFAGLVIAVIFAAEKAPGGPLPRQDLLVEEERCPELYRPRSAYDVLKGVQDKELLIVAHSVFPRL
ncbi:hypothetical protein MRX96_019820 [Rhipicephalus microplus]